MRIEKQEPDFRPIKITIETQAELLIVQNCLQVQASVDIFSDICKSKVNIAVTLKEVENCIQRLSDIMKL